MITRRLAEFAANIRFEDLPAATAGTAKRQFLDGLGCLIAGTASGPGNCAADMVRGLGGNPQATIFADGTRSSVCHAAFVNGITLYSVGLNDYLEGAGAHPGASVIPTLLAVGEWRRSSGRDLLAAMAAGYDVIDRIGRAIMPSHRERGFHPTGTCGTFGAAAAAGRLLGMNGDEIACAFGIAGSQAAGLYEYINDGTSTIMFHAGRAAKNGVEAVLLTKAGLTGPATVLEGTRGFFGATSDVIDSRVALSGLSQRFALNDTTSRPYFGCTSTIAASGATAQIMQRSSRAGSGEIKRARVFCNPIVASDNAEVNPRTLLAARLSMPFNVALVLARGDVLVRDLEEKDLADERVRALLPLVELVGDPNIPRFGSTVQVQFMNGSSEEVAMPSWHGSATDPLSWDEVVLKFQRLVGPVIAEQHQQRIITAVADIDTSGALELSTVLGDAISSGRTGKQQALQSR